ncbi:MAG: hypothetical protein EOP53_26990, partial [Sphingobacteriales bacterium]
MNIQMKKLLLPILVLLLLAGFKPAKIQTVTGIVRGDDGQPIPGATIATISKTVSTKTNSEGKFKIELPDNEKELIVSFIGYKNEKVTINSKKILTITLSADARSLDQVVITAGGVSIKRREQGNQATTVQAQELVGASQKLMTRGHIVG